MADTHRKVHPGFGPLVSIQVTTKFSKSCFWTHLLFPNCRFDNILYGIGFSLPPTPVHHARFSPILSVRDMSTEARSFLPRSRETYASSNIFSEDGEDESRKSNMEPFEYNFWCARKSHKLISGYFCTRTTTVLWRGRAR